MTILSFYFFVNCFVNWQPPAAQCLLQERDAAEYAGPPRAG